MIGPDGEHGWVDDVGFFGGVEGLVTLTPLWSLGLFARWPSGSVGSASSVRVASSVGAFASVGAVPSIWVIPSVGAFPSVGAVPSVGAFPSIWVISSVGAFASVGVVPLVEAFVSIGLWGTAGAHGGKTAEAATLFAASGPVPLGRFAALASIRVVRLGPVPPIRIGRFDALAGVASLAVTVSAPGTSPPFAGAVDGLRGRPFLGRRLPGRRACRQGWLSWRAAGAGWRVRRGWRGRLDRRGGRPRRMHRRGRKPWWLHRRRCQASGGGFAVPILGMRKLFALLAASA